MNTRMNHHEDSVITRVALLKSILPEQVRSSTHVMAGRLVVIYGINMSYVQCISKMKQLGYSATVWCMTLAR